MEIILNEMIFIDEIFQLCVFHEMTTTIWESIAVQSSDICGHLNCSIMSESSVQRELTLHIGIVSHERLSRKM